MPDITERMIASLREHKVRTGLRPTTIYLGWYEIHEYKTSNIFTYYNKKADSDQMLFYSCEVFEVMADNHLTVA